MSNSEVPHTKGSSPQAPLRSVRHPRTTRLWRWLTVPIIGLFLFYAAVGYLVSSFMIGENPRWRGINRGPHDFGLKGETVSFLSQDGIALKAWWLPAEGNPLATVIIAHGIDHTRQVMLPRASFLVRGGYNVLALDLRGHGESAAQYVSPGYLEARDVLGAVQYIRERGVHAPIALLGVSLGATASILAAADSREISAVIADGVSSSYREVFDNICSHYVHDSHTKLWLRGVFLAARFPGLVRAIVLVYYARTGIYLGSDFVSVLPYAARIRVPVLLISGDRDWIVPTAQVRKVLAVLPTERKSLVIIPNAVHDTTYSAAPALYQSAVLGFLDSNLPK